MKTCFIILVFISLLAISELKSIADAAVGHESVWRTDEEVMAMYEEWMVEYGKSYNNALGEEKLKRFEIFKDNLKYIDEHNRLPNQTFKLGLNQFSDLTLDEFKSIYLSSSPIDTWSDESDTDYSYLPEVDYSISSLPKSVDWRKQGAVVPIKNQQSCGSCWAFSAIASVEAINKIKSGNLISLSEQMLVDCVNASYGCDGGRQTDAFQYIKDNGIACSQDYPYEAKQGECQKKKIVLKIDRYGIVLPKHERLLQRRASIQVVSISIKAGSKDFQLYKSGIFRGKCSDKIDHGVNIVGYGFEGKDAFWIVRNSWGESWGEKGYIRMPRNIDDPEGYCGLALAPTYPIMGSGDEGHVSVL